MHMLRKFMLTILCLTVVLACGTMVQAAEEKSYCPYGHTTHQDITCDAEIITWSEWTKTDSLPTTGNYYLTEDVTITATSKPSNLNLDLNGCNVTRLIEVGDTDDCNVFSVVTAKSFLLADTNAERHGIVSVTWEVGAETANAAKWGKVVKVGPNATMRLYGGIIDGSNITQNTAQKAANATLNVENATDKNDAAFYMYGGKVIGITNYSTAGKTYGTGSAIIARGGTTLEIYGGEVVGGKCRQGACIYSTTNKTSLLGGTFVGGVATSAAAGVYINSSSITIGNVVMDGGVFIYKDCAKLTLTGAPQIGNTCSSGYGICLGSVSTGTINATGLTADARINIKNNRSDITLPFIKVDEDLSACFTFVNANQKAKYDPETGTLSMVGYVAAETAVCWCADCKGEKAPAWTVWDGKTALAAGHYYLDKNTELTADGTLAPAEAATTVLNLNGYTLSKPEAGRMFLLKGKANLVIMDSSAYATGAVIGNGGNGDGMVILTESADASAEIHGGTFSRKDSAAKAKNGALFYAAAGSIKVTGGEFHGAAAEKGGIGAAGAGGTLEITGGSFHAGKADKGDTLYAAEGSALTISGNPQLDGGVEIGSGVNVAISGTPVIRKKTEGSAYALKTDSPITVGELAVGARVFVTGTKETTITTAFASANAASTAKKFISADSKNMKIVVADNTLKLAPMVMDAAVIQQRRDLAEAYMRQQTSLLWKATEDITYCFSRTSDDPSQVSSSSIINIKAGRIYRGLPYAYSYTTMSSFLEYAGEQDANGVYPISGISYKTMSGLSTQTRMGNDCSSAVVTAWSQFGASIYGTTSAGLVPQYGAVPVGNYIPLESYGETGTAVVIENNGATVMYESYALLQKADALVRYKSANNHAMMVVSVNVVRNSDGSINPTSSYAIVLEQTSSNVRNEKTYTDPTLGTVYIIGGVDKKYTFKYLLDNTYIPLTCMELLDAAPVDVPAVADTVTEPTLDNLFEGTITSNRFVGSVIITIADEDGNPVQKAAQNACRSYPREFRMAEFLTGKPKQWSRGEIDVDALADGKYRCTVVCRLSTEQVFTVRDFEFTLGDGSKVIEDTATGIKYRTVEKAIEACAAGSVLRLVADIPGDIEIGKDITLDLNGFNVGGIAAKNGAVVKLKDSKTDDYTVEDGEGYGKITGTVSGVAAEKGYMMITEKGETSFHRLNLDTVSLTLRANVAGIYYRNQFGGDEVVKRNIVAYGSALGAGIIPNFARGTFTRFEADTWKAGMDGDGNSNNMATGTLLYGILKEDNDAGINKYNASIKVYSQAYVELADGSRILGDMVSYSLQDVVAGAAGITGIDARWNELTEEQKASVLQMYATYESLMSTWEIPNIKAAYKNA